MYTMGMSRVYVAGSVSPTDMQKLLVSSLVKETLLKDNFWLLKGPGEPP